MGRLRTHGAFATELEASKGDSNPMTTTTSDVAEAAPPARLYRVGAAMELLSLSRSVIYELIRSGQLRSVREGRPRRIPGSAIAEYIALLGSEAD